MMASKLLAPPPLVARENYETWKKEMVLWEMATTVEKKKRAPTVFLSLTGKAREAILELDASLLNTEDGLNVLIKKLDTLFQEDKNQAALLAYDKFEQYKRPEDFSINEYLVEFERLVIRLKNYNIDLPEPVLAYRVLRSSNLSEENERLVRATVQVLTFDAMALQLKRVMGNIKMEKSGIKENSIVVKKEPETTLPMISEVKKEQDNGSCETYYERWGRGQRTNRRQNYSGTRGRYSRGRFQNKKNTNPVGRNNEPSVCNVCGSIYHWARECPDKEISLTEGDIEKKEKISDVNLVLFKQNEFESVLLEETIGCIVLDSGCTKTVCGIKWYDLYLDGISKEMEKNIEEKPGVNTFRFGDGERITSLKNVTIPCRICNTVVKVNTDIVSADIPMLLSKESMKRASTRMDFKNDTVQMFGKQQKLHVATTGHYFLPITKILPKEGNSYEILFLKKVNEKNKEQKLKIAWKLHKQFSHPSGKKMVGLAKSAKIKDKEFLKMLEELPDLCEVCLRYKKTPPRPIVGLSLATRFNETVAMDIKEILGYKVLHMIDHGTRYSVAAKIPNKESQTIIETVFRYWISYFGAPKNFLTDNGGEFNNQYFRDMAQNMNIIVHTTAAESPWSNGLNERHNAILGEMVKKTREDVECSMDQAIGWAVSAKNALVNVDGYSPNQLVFGWNINIPTCLNSQAPALEGIATSEIVAKNLNAIHAARKSFIENESAEKLRRAFRHQIRPHIGYEFSNGDLVLFKRIESDRWIGPGTVIGSENKQVLVKHGGTYVRVHPTRLRFYSTSVDENGRIYANKEMEDKQEITSLKEIETGNIDNDSEDEEEELENATDKNVILPSRKETVIPRKGDNISVKTMEEQDLWRKCYVLGRAGKATGKNKYFINVRFDEGDCCLDFEKKVVDWKMGEVDIQSNLL